MEQGKYKNQACREGHPRNGVYLPHTSASPAVAAAFLHLLRRRRRYPLASFASLAVLSFSTFPAGAAFLRLLRRQSRRAAPELAGEEARYARCGIDFSHMQ